MSGVPVPEPRFPGGRDRAPEVAPGGCANASCSCAVEAGRTFCCQACARSHAATPVCPCGHGGCAARAF